jgi:cellulose synthase/poly-beta-1,6-N-acetylglucosamine synthase-like glycosyltransferase
MPVLPGPCGLYRYKELGSLKEGVMHEYFSLCCQPVDSIIFGNVQLSEDRIPSCLLVFRDESKNKQAATNHKPRTGFVHDAVFYFEAEKPLSQLVKQRRRWINGTYAAYLWVFREGWLWKGNHEFYIKLFATAFVVIQLLQGAFVRLCGPSVMAVGLYTSCLAIPVLASNSYKVMLQELYEETAAQDTSQESRIVASLMALAYLTIYSIFVFGHTPRAIPVRDDSSREISVNSRFDDFSGYLIRSVKYRSDRRSAYRPRLFALAFLANALVVLLLMALCVSAFLQFGWAATPLALRLAVVFLVAPYGVAFLDGIINSRRPNVTSVFTLIWATPCFLLASIWFYIWLPAYATARISDLSWGNRDNGCDEQDSSVAKHREIVGKKVGAALVMSNFVVAGISICLVHMVPGALQVVIIFCVGVPCVHYAISVIDMLIRLVRKFIRLVRKVVSLCCISAAAKRRTGYSDSLEMLLKAVNMNSFEDKPCFFVFNVRGKSDGGYSLQKTMRLLPQDQGVDSHVPETVLAVSSDNTRQAHGGSGTSPRMVTNFSEFNESLEDSMTKRDKAISKAVALKTLQDNRDRAEKKMTNLYDDILILSGQRDREARVIMMYQRAKAEYVQLEHKVSKLTGIHFDDSLQEDWEWFLQPQYLRRFAVAERGGTEAEEQKQAIAVGQQELFDVDDSADHSVARQQHEGPEGEASVGSCDSSLLSTFFSVYEEDTASLEPPRKIRLVVV